MILLSVQQRQAEFSHLTQQQMESELHPQQSGNLQKYEYVAQHNALEEQRIRVIIKASATCPVPPDSESIQRGLTVRPLSCQFAHPTKRSSSVNLIQFAAKEITNALTAENLLVASINSKFAALGDAFHHDTALLETRVLAHGLAADSVRFTAAHIHVAGAANALAPFDTIKANCAAAQFGKMVWKWNGIAIILTSHFETAVLSVNRKGPLRDLCVDQLLPARQLHGTVIGNLHHGAYGFFPRPRTRTLV